MKKTKRRCFIKSLSLKRFMTFAVMLCMLFSAVLMPAAYASEYDVSVQSEEQVLANGVYYIKKGDSYFTSSLTFQTSKYTSVPDSLTQMWKIYHVGDGSYTIRPMDSLSCCLNGAGTQLQLYGDSVDDVDELMAHSRWLITEATEGYQITIYTYKWKLSEFLISMPSGSWTFERVTAPPSGVLLKSTQSWIAPKSTATFKAAVYSGSTIDQSVTWSSSNTAVATVSSTGVVTGVSQGTATITAKSTYNTSWQKSFTVNVSNIPNSPYYLRNKETDKYLDIKNSSTSEGEVIHQWQFYGHNSQKWIVELQQDGYYTIKSVCSGLYLSVQDNSSAQNASIIQASGGSASGQRWKFTRLSNGGYKITPKCGESTDKCLAVGDYLLNVNGIAVEQKTYANASNRQDEWEFAFTYVHYYDGSMSDTLIAKIPNAHNTASKAFYDTFDIRFAYKGEPTLYEDALTDDCNKLPLFPCDESCGALNQCATKHHKNIIRISDQLYDDFREANHVYVLWTNRMNEYCLHTTNSHEIIDAMACVYNKRPIIHIMYIDMSEQDNREASMGINLIHETAHTLGLEEQYNLPEHGGNVNEYICCMEKYNPYYAKTYYKTIKQNGSCAFCDSCKSKLSDLIYDCWHKEYLP